MIADDKPVFSDLIKMSISKLFIEETKNTPEISMDPGKGVFVLKGKSIPENATQLYDPVVKWLKEYINKPADETNLHFNLIYFNTASSIWMARIIKILSRINDPEKIFIINLYFHLEEYDEMEAEDMHDAIAPALDVLNEATVSLGVKIFGTDDSGKIIKKRLILI